MKNLDALADGLTEALDALDAAREEALAVSREVVRLSGSAIKAVHRGQDPREPLEAARDAAKRLRNAVKGKPGLEGAGFTDMAYQELTEAHLVHAVARGKAFPSPRSLGVPPGAYVLGMGDLVGELRRFALNALIRGDVSEARERLDQMEDVYGTLMRFDYPSALVDVRRKQDAARGMLERTRGEIAVAVRGRRLEGKIDKLSEMLDELEGEKKADARKRKARRTNDAEGGDDFPDVDKVW